MSNTGFASGRLTYRLEFEKENRKLKKSLKNGAKTLRLQYFNFFLNFSY